MKKLDINQVLRELAYEAFGDDNFTIDDFDWDRVWITRNNQEYTIRTWNITENDIEWTLFKMTSNGGERENAGVYIIKHPEKQAKTSIANSNSQSSRTTSKDGETKENKLGFARAVLNLLGKRVITHHGYSDNDVEITIEVRFESDSANDIMNFVHKGLEAKGFDPSDIRYTFGDGDWMTVSIQNA